MERRVPAPVDAISQTETIEVKGFEMDIRLCAISYIISWTDSGTKVDRMPFKRWGCLTASTRHQSLVIGRPVGLLIFQPQDVKINWSPLAVNYLNLE
jgi:hypothetical protein